MKRRNFIKIMALSACATSAYGLVYKYADKDSHALEAWNGPSKVENDIRILVLSYAILAPNPHNKQPWLIQMKGDNSFDLYVDPDRLLPESDPPHRQIHIGQGTFLENLSIAARNLGYRPKIDYFPEGMYGNDTLEEKPVASITLIQDPFVKPDILFNYILRRQSNKRIYDKKPLAQSQLADLTAALDYDTNDYGFNISTNVLVLEQLSEMLTEAMSIDTSDQQRDDESLAMFRFNDGELEQHRDGFGVPQMGADGVRKLIIENLFISRKSLQQDRNSWRAQSTEGARKQAESAAAFGWLTSSNNTRLNQIEAGRMYNRINLAATALGIAIHPMSQILQEYPDMQSLQHKLKDFLGVPNDHTIQMLFRLGIAEDVTHSARRPVEDMFMNKKTSAEVTVVEYEGH